MPLKLAPRAASSAGSPAAAMRASRRAELMPPMVAEKRRRGRSPLRASRYPPEMLSAKAITSSAASHAR